MRQSRQERAAGMRAKRDAAILDAAISLAMEQGYQWITRDEVARRAGVAPACVNLAFRYMVELKREVLRQAVTRGIPEIVAQGLAEHHEIARNAPPELRARAVALIS